jgi:hypothetical protein
MVESNFGDGMFTSLLRPILAKVHPCGLEEIRSSVQKEKRIIDTLEPIMNQHRLIVSEEVAVNDYQKSRKHPHHQLFFQLTRITRDRGSLQKDDRIDALAGACAYWLEAMGRDAGKAVESMRQDMIDEMCEEYEEKMGRILGDSGERTGRNNWISKEAGFAGMDAYKE